MAQSSIFWQTDGTGDGLTGGYSQAQMVQWLRSLLVAVGSPGHLGGVSAGYQNELAVTGTITPVSVNTGAASVYGFPYFNTAPEAVAVPTPVGGTRIDRIVLRADWTAQTVRITHIAGTPGGGAPALTQTPGVAWDVPLAQLSITTGGAITVTDQRVWLTVAGYGGITGERIAPGAVTEDKIGAGAVTEDKIGTGAVTVNKIGAGAVTTNKLGDNAVTEGKIGAGAVTNSKIAPEAVTYDKIALGGVIESRLGVLSVTNSKLGPEAVTYDKIALGGVIASRIGAGAVTEAKLDTGAVTNSKLAPGAVTEGKIGTGAVTANKIGAGAVTTNKLGDNAVTEGKINNNSVTTNKLAPEAVTTAKLQTGAVITNRLADDAVTRAKLHPTSFMPVYLAKPALSPSSNNTTATPMPLGAAHATHGDGVFSLTTGTDAGVRVAVAGLYLIDWGAVLSSYAASRDASVWLARNGTQIDLSVRRATFQNTYESLGASIVMTLAALDTITLWFRNLVLGTPSDAATLVYPAYTSVRLVLLAQS